MDINMIDGFDENSADALFWEDVDPYTKARISEIIEKDCKDNTKNHTFCPGIYPGFILLNTRFILSVFE